MDMDAEAVRESPVGDPVQDPEGKGEEEQGEEGGPSSSPGPGSEVLHSPQNVDCEDLVADGDHGTHVAVGVEGPHPAAAAAVFDVYADHAHAAPTDVIADIVHEERDQGKEELAGERAVEEEEVALGGGGGVSEEEKAEEEQEDEVKDLVVKVEEHRPLPWEEGGGSLSSEERSVLELVAATGGVWHGWNRVRSLIRHHMIEVLDAYNDLRKSSAAASGAIGPPRPLPTGESYDELKERLVEELEKFEDGPPFTIQRLCELLLNPRQHSDLARISFALEKVLMVTSSTPKPSQPCPPLPVPPAVKKIIYWRPSTPAERAAAAAAAGTAGRAGTVDPSASEVVEGREGELGGEAEAMDEERAAVVPEVERGEENQQAQIAAAALAEDALEGATVVDRVTEADVVADEVRATEHEDDGSAMQAGGGQEEAGWREEADTALPNAAEPMQVDEERMLGRQEHRQQGDELMVEGVVEEDTAGHAGEEKSQQEVLGPQAEGEELHDALQLQELEHEQREAEQHQQRQQQVDGTHAQDEPLSNSAEVEAEAGAEAGPEAEAEPDSSKYAVGEDVAPTVGYPEGSMLSPAFGADSEALKQAKESSPERRARAEDELDHELRKSKLQRLVHEVGVCKEPLCEKEKKELSDSLELEGVIGETKGGADAGVNVGISSESAQERGM